MLTLIPSLPQLSQIIAQVAAPSFLLGAVAAFIAVVVSRLNRIIDRSQLLTTISADDAARAFLKNDIPQLKRRARHLNRSILLSTISAIATAFLVIVAFISAFMGMQHEYGVAVLFIVALSFFIVSLIELVREVRIALHELDMMN